MVYSADRSKAVVPVLVLLFVSLWFILRGDLFYILTLCYFVFVFFSPFNIAITSLGEERANCFVFSNGSLVICHCMQIFNLVSIWMQIKLVILSI